MIRKLLILLTFGLFAANMNAQVNYYQAKQFAIKYVNNGVWTDWSDWEDSNVMLSIDEENDLIKVYTENRQTYVVVKHNGSYTDSSGGKQIEFGVVDQDGDKGKVRLRLEKNGNAQLYVEFKDIMWVYSGLKRLRD